MKRYDENSLRILSHYRYISSFNVHISIQRGSCTLEQDCGNVRYTNNTDVCFYHYYYSSVSELSKLIKRYNETFLRIPSQSYKSVFMFQFKYDLSERVFQVSGAKLRKCTLHIVRNLTITRMCAFITLLICVRIVKRYNENCL